jgi:hypothetical protein
LTGKRVARRARGQSRERFAPASMMVFCGRQAGELMGTGPEVAVG